MEIHQQNEVKTTKTRGAVAGGIEPNWHLHADVNPQRGESQDDLISCCFGVFNQDTRMKYDEIIHVRIEDFHNFHMAEMHRPPPRKLRLGPWGGLRVLTCFDMFWLFSANHQILGVPVIYPGKGPKSFEGQAD